MKISKKDFIIKAIINKTPNKALYFLYEELSKIEIAKFIVKELENSKFKTNYSLIREMSRIITLLEKSSPFSKKELEHKLIEWEKKPTSLYKEFIICFYSFLNNGVIAENLMKELYYILFINKTAITKIDFLLSVANSLYKIKYGEKDTFSLLFGK